jgi:PAS domain S-box-containing protein
MEMKVKSTQLCDFFFNQTDNITLITNKKGIIEFITPVFLEKNGLEPNTIIRTSFYDYVEKMDKKTIQKTFETIIQKNISQKSISCGIKLPTQNTKKFYITIKLIDIKPNQQEFVLLLKEIKLLDQQKIDYDYVSDMMDYSLDVIFKLKMNGDILYINNATKSMAGFDPEEMIGKKWMQFVPKSELPRYFLKVKEMVSGAKINDFQTFVNHKNGHLIPVELAGYVIKKQNKRYIIGVMRDLSNRIESKNILDHYNTKLQDEIHTKQKLINELDKELQDHINRYQLLFEKAKEAIAIAQDNQLKLVNPAFEKISGYSSDEIYKKSFIEFIHPDDQKIVYDRYQQRLKGRPIESTYEFRFVNKKGEVRWAETHSTLIKWNEKPATLNFLIDITDRIEIEKKYQILFDTIPNAIVELDSETHQIISINEVMAHRFNSSKDKMIGKDFTKFLPRELYKAREKTSLKVIKENRIQTEIDKRDNSILENTYVPITYPTGKINLLIISKDITDIKKTQEKLRSSEQKFKEIFNSSADAIFIHDPKDMRIIDVNDETCKRFEYSKQELIKTTIDKISKTPLFSMNLPESQRAFQQVMNGEVVKREWLSKTKHGKLIWHEIIGKLIELDGKPRFLAIARDIRDRKKAEDQMKHYSENLENEVKKKTNELRETLNKLQSSEMKFRTLFELAPIGIGILDQKRNIIECNKNLQNLTGYSRNKDKPLRIDFDQHCVDKKDREIIHKKLEKTHHLDNYEIQLKKKNGDIYTALLNIETIQLDGKPYLLTIERDISDLKRKEQQLKDAYSYLEKTINSATESIVAVDKDLNIKLYNQAFLNLFDRKIKHIKKTPLKSLIDQPSIITDTINNIKQGKKTIQGTLSIIQPSGEKRLVSFTATGIGDDIQNPEGYLFLGNDITVDASRFGKIQNGLGYLIQGDSMNKLIDLIDYLQLKGYHGIWYSRKNAGSYGAYESNEYLHLKSYHEIPFHSTTDLKYLLNYLNEIQTAISSNKKNFVVLGRVDYLLSHYHFEVLMKWLYDLSTIIQKNNAILFIHLPKKLIDDEKYAYIAAEFSQLPDQYTEDIALEEPLIDILDFIKSEQGKNTLISYHHVGKRFNISKVTTKKRLDELQTYGLISIQEKGRMKVVKITNKAQTLLNKRELI